LTSEFLDLANSYDVVVIGAGTGGYVAAIRAAQLGKKVAVVESRRLSGGTCLIWGCIPTKALLEHAHALKVITNAKEWGVTIPAGTPTIEMGQVHTRKDKIVTGLTKGVEFLFKKNKIDWIKGTARLAGNGRVEVVDGATQTLEAKDIIVATGSEPRSVPGITDRSQAHHHQRRRHQPERGAEVSRHHGSGAVGVEFASIYRRFGSEVTIIELLPRLVPVEDEAVSAELEKSFRSRASSAHRTKVTKATAPQRRRHRGADADGKTQKLSADICSSRPARPGHDGLGVEELGIEMDAATSRSTSCIAPRCRIFRDRRRDYARRGVHPQLATCRRWKGS
jgi:dihydrolipoamide dehydrogenase